MAFIREEKIQKESINSDSAERAGKQLVESALKSESEGCMPKAARISNNKKKIRNYSKFGIAGVTANGTRLQLMVLC